MRAIFIHFSLIKDLIKKSMPEHRKCTLSTFNEAYSPRDLFMDTK